MVQILLRTLNVHNAHTFQFAMVVARYNGFKMFLNVGKIVLVLILKVILRIF